MASYTTQLQQLYVAYYNRPADPIGLAFWQSNVTAAVASGKSVATALATVSSAFASSAEYTSAYAGKTSAQIIDQVYQNLFGRAAEVGGLTFWALALDQGTYTLANIVTIVSSNALTTDKVAFDSKVSAATSFTTALDTNAEILGYSGASALALAKAFISTVKDAATLATAIVPATLDATIAAVVAGGGQVGTTYTLTAGVDTFVGGTANDTFTAGATATFNALDSIDGGAGTDTLNVTDNAAAVGTAGRTVKNVEIANLASSGTVTADTTGWTGLTTLNVTGATGAVGITASNTTAVSSVNTGGTVTTTGGSTVTVSTTAQAVNVNSGTAGAVTKATVSGSTAVTIADTNSTKHTIANVALTSNNTATAAITSDVLTSLSLTDSQWGATVTAAAGTRALAIATNGLTTANVAITDATATGVTLANTGAASTITTLALAANKSLAITADKALTITTLNDAAMTSLSVGGAALTTVGAFGTTNVLTGVTVTGAGGLKADLSGQTALTSIDASASSGANTVSVDGTKSTYTGGSGVDTVTLAAAPTKAIKGGAGTADVLVVNAASFSLTNATEFEVLGAGAAATGAYSAAGYTAITQGAVAGNLTWNTVAAGTGLTMTASPGWDTVYTLATDTATDTLNLTMTSAAALTGGTLTATSVETVNITVTDTDSTAHTNTLTLVDTALSTLKISGNSSLTLTNTNTTVTSVDASGLTKGAFIWTTGALATAAVTIKGSLLGGDTINAAASTKAVTITETAGTNSITGSSTIASTLTGGTGVDTITGGAGKDTIVGGGGADVITAGAGADKITITGNTATIVQAAGSSGTNTSTTIQTAELTSTFDVVYGATAGTKINLGNASIVTGTLTTAGTNLAAGVADTAVFARGTYDSAAGTFTYAANGADTVITYDADVAVGVTAESIILVGFVSGASTAAAGVLTLVG